MEFAIGFIAGGVTAGLVAYFYGKRVGLEISKALAGAAQMGSNLETAQKDLRKGL